MKYSKEYNVKEEHIDFQGIMDGLYYPFYMEDCRHQFAKDELDFDLEKSAKEGINMILSEYTIKFHRSLVKDDSFEVTCVLYSDPNNLPKFYIKQEIIRNKKLITSAIFTATCIKSTGGRPFIPESLKEKISSAPKLEID